MRAGIFLLLSSAIVFSVGCGEVEPEAKDNPGKFLVGETFDLDTLEWGNNKQRKYAPFEITIKFESDTKIIGNIFCNVYEAHLRWHENAIEVTHRDISNDNCGGRTTEFDIKDTLSFTMRGRNMILASPHFIATFKMR